MEAILHQTKGLGGLAVVETNGRKLTVEDNLSAAGSPAVCGYLPDVQFTYVCDGPNWEEMLRGNPAGLVKLEPIGGVRYLGYGRIVSIKPVVIDFGLLQMVDGHWVYDESLVGRYVLVHVDRLQVRHA